jgi:hypothetical protein
MVRTAVKLVSRICSGYFNGGDFESSSSLTTSKRRYAWALEKGSYRGSFSTPSLGIENSPDLGSKSRLMRVAVVSTGRSVGPVEIPCSLVLPGNESLTEMEDQSASRET